MQLVPDKIIDWNRSLGPIPVLKPMLTRVASRRRKRQTSSKELKNSLRTSNSARVIRSPSVLVVVWNLSGQSPSSVRKRIRRKNSVFRYAACRSRKVLSLEVAETGVGTEKATPKNAIPPCKRCACCHDLPHKSNGNLLKTIPVICIPTLMHRRNRQHLQAGNVRTKCLVRMSRIVENGLQSWKPSCLQLVNALHR